MEGRARNALIAAGAFTAAPLLVRALDRVSGNQSGHLIDLFANPSVRGGATDVGGNVFMPRVARVISEQKFDTAGAKQWRDVLFKGDKPRGWKQIEDDVYHVRDWLDTQIAMGRKTPIAKDELGAWLDAGRPDIRVETLVDEDSLEPGLDVMEIVGKTHQGPPARWSNVVGEEVHSLNASNYREVVISEPRNRMADAPFVADHHTGETKNPVVWLRLNERIDSNGDRVLYVEEIQSDMDQYARRVQRGGGQVGSNPEPTTRDWTNSDADPGNIFEPVSGDATMPKESTYSGVIAPDFAHRGRTTELATRYLIADARRRGIKKISWTPGKLQADRNNIMRNVEWIEYDKANKVLSGMMAFDSVWNPGRTFQYDVEMKDLAAYVGEPVARQLVNTESTVRTLDTNAKVGEWLGEAAEKPADQMAHATAGQQHVLRALDKDRWMKTADDYGWPRHIMDRWYNDLVDLTTGAAKAMRDLDAHPMDELQGALADKFGELDELAAGTRHPDMFGWIWQEFESIRFNGGDLIGQDVGLPEGRIARSQVPDGVNSMPGLTRQYDQGIPKAIRQVLDKEVGIKGQYEIYTDGSISPSGMEHQVISLPDGMEGKSNTFNLFSHGSVGGGLLGATVGMTHPDIDEEHRGFATVGLGLAGAGAGHFLPKLFGGGPDAISKTDAAMLDSRPTARRLLMERNKASAEHFANLASQLGLKEGFGDKVANINQEMIDRFRQIRFEWTRRESPIEDLDHELAVAMAQGRGHAGAAELDLAGRYAKMLEQHNDVLYSAQSLAMAQRELELGRLGKELGKTPQESALRVRELVAVLDEFKDDFKVQQAADDLRGYYRYLLDLKADAGVIGPESYNRIVSKGEYYVPFLPEEIVDEVTKGGTTYRPNDAPGVRRMSKHLNEAVVEDLYVQAVRDTYETHRRIARHNVAQRLNRLYDADPDAFEGLVTKLDYTPDNAFANDKILSVLDGNERRYYRIEDDLLAKAWSSYTESLNDDTMISMLTGMRRFMQRGVTLAPVFQVRNGIRDFFMSAAQYPLFGGGRALASSAGAGAIYGAATGDDAEDILRGAVVGSAALGGAHLGIHAVRTADAMFSILGPDAMGMIFGGFRWLHAVRRGRHVRGQGEEHAWRRSRWSVRG